MRVHQRSCSHRVYQKQQTRRRLIDQASNAHDNTQFRLGCSTEAVNGAVFDEEWLQEYSPEDNEDEAWNSVTACNEHKESSVDMGLESSCVTTTAMLHLAKLSRISGRNAVNDIIKVLNSPDFSMERFRRTCRSTADCIKIEDRILEKGLIGLGFRKVTICNFNEGMNCEVYLRSPIEVLRLQIRGSSASSTIFNATVGDVLEEGYSHPMMAELGKYGEKAVRDTVMSRSEQDIMWHDETNSTERSFAGMIQLYSDKSQTSLKESSFQFYPMHMTLLNFSEQDRRQNIVSGRTTIAFLPVKINRIENGKKVEVNPSRVEYLKLLHRSIDAVLEELKKAALEGFRCVDADGTIRRCHPCIASYVCDIPESKDIAPVRNGNSGTRNCHRCTAETNRFNTYTACPQRRGVETISLIHRAWELRKLGRNREADDILREYSLTEFVPSFHDFPFMGKHRVLDFHSIFMFEILHNFHLGISRMLKTCLSERLKSTILKTAKVPTNGGNIRTACFRTVRMTILAGINRMLAHIQRYSPAKGLKIDFAKGGTAGDEKGLYGAEGNLIGMLEGKDYRQVDTIFPFIGMFLDRCSDEVHSALSTNVFVLYVEIMQTAVSNNSPDGTSWNEMAVQKLEQKIAVFKKKATDMYATFQPSKLCTEKMHSLDHIGEDIRRLGGLYCGDASLYEYSHTLVKRAHRSTSKRRYSAMQETITNYTKDISVNKTNGFNQDNCTEMPSRRSVIRPQKSFPSRSEAITNDSASLVKRGTSFTLEDLNDTRKLWRQKRIAESNGASEHVTLIKQKLKQVENGTCELLQDLGETGSRVLYRELLRVLEEEYGVTSIEKRTSVVVRTASGYVSGIPTPTAKNYDVEQKNVTVKESGTRVAQRFVASNGFYNNPNQRQDDVVLEAKRDESSGELNLWFGKVLGLFRLRHKNTTAISNTMEEEEMAFVQFYDVTPLQDQVEKSLGCIRLKWSMGDAEENDDHDIEDQDKHGTKWFTLLPVAAIRGVVHVLRGDYGIDNRGLGLDMEGIPWNQQHFYVNRFYHDPDCEHFSI